MGLFNAANSFCLYRLSKLCLTFLCNECNDENVLEVVAYFHDYLKHICELNADSSQTPEKPNTAGNEAAADEDLLEMLNRLIYRCYAIIDYYAEKIISSEEFFDLNYDLVSNILWRDTLNLTSELEVFIAINQWACQQCKKACKELTDMNKRQILGELIFYPRYLTMNLDEFQKGPYNSDILTFEEKHSLLERIKGSESVTELPKHMQIFKLNVERHYEEMDEDDDGASSSTESACESKADQPLKPTVQLKGKKKTKKSKSKKILNGLGEVVLCVIKLLD